MEQKKYVRLCYKERVIIETLLQEKKSRSFISKQINRSRSTLTRELNKWLNKPSDVYKADIAQWCAEDDYKTKRGLDKISNHKRLKIYVYRGLINGWSPEQIAGRIKLEYPQNTIMNISHEAIYTHIYNHNQGRLRRKLIGLLVYSKSKRRSRKGVKKARKRIKDPTSIDLRPPEVMHRKEVGHWEGDLVVGVKQSSAIGTLVERKTRLTHIVKLKNRKSETVTQAFKTPLKKMKRHFRKTLTYDNGMEMANHKWFTDQTHMSVYFAHPYSSWERGTNENTNGLIRRYFPKGTDFNKVTENQLKHVEDKLNNRPRKILCYRTPLEMIEIENNMLLRSC